MFRMADVILDIMVCSPGASGSGGMVLGAGDVMASLQRVVFMVGGQRSEFFGKLQRRLETFKTSELGNRRLLPVESGPPAHEPEDEDRDDDYSHYDNWM